MMRSRPTTYRGTPMRSRLEAAYAEQFDSWGWQWEYEPRCFATTDGQYLPDFYVMDDAGDTWYVEIKPSITPEQLCDIANHDLPRWARIIAANDPTADGFLLFFGANPAGVLSVFGALFTPTGVDGPFVVDYSHATPVASLHGVRFAGGRKRVA